METKSPPQNIQTINKTQIQQKLQDDNIIFMIKPISPQYQKSIMMIKPHDYLPKPEPPPGFSSSTNNNNHPSLSLIHENPATVVSIGNFFREKSNSFSNAITKSLSALKNNNNDEEEKILEINLPGVKVTKSLKQHKGRVSFFSRSNCRDCTAVRSFLKQRSLHYVEINIDVYPTREKDLFERTGGFSVPQIFFNGDLIGGLVAFNSLRNGGMLDKKLDDILCVKCPDDAPKPPVYGLEEEDIEEEEDGMAGVVRVVRQKVPIRDRIAKMKIVGNCFSGSDLVHALINHFHYERKKAVEIGKQLSLKHFIHHVFGENEFEDGNHLYRFLDHEPFIPKCHNFRGSLNDQEPKTASSVSQKLMILMSAIIESYASDDRRHLDYMGISNSEEFRRYLNLVEDLQRVNLLTLAEDERLAFFLNLYNSMTIHAVIRIGHPGDMIDRRTFFSDFMYVIGGSSYSLSSIMNGILRGNSRPPFSIVKPFSSGDKRLELTFPKMNQLIHFGTCNATRGSPSVKIFSSKSVGSELKNAAKEYFQREDGMQVDLAKRTVYLSRILKWYSTDFGSEKEIIKWVMNYLDATMAGLLTHLLSDGGTVNIVYQNFDWSLNC